MPGIKHILFPVDFSDRSDGAAPFVAALAAKYDAQVTLLTAAHANYAGGLAGAPMIDPQSILDAVQEQLDRTYLAEFSGSYVTTYGGLASAMVALVFLYWTAGIFMYGGELNQAIRKRIANSE